MARVGEPGAWLTVSEAMALVIGWPCQSRRRIVMVAVAVEVGRRYGDDARGGRVDAVERKAARSVAAEDGEEAGAGGDDVACPIAVDIAGAQRGRAERQRVERGCEDARVVDEDL